MARVAFPAKLLHSKLRIPGFELKGGMNGEEVHRGPRHGHWRQ